MRNAENYILSNRTETGYPADPVFYTAARRV